MVLFGEVMDVTKFLPIHPGGAAAADFGRGCSNPPIILFDSLLVSLLVCLFDCLFICLFV